MLEMAIEVLNTGEIVLRRPNREFLLSIRRGEASYDEVISLITDREVELDEACENSQLPEDVDVDIAHKILLEIREQNG
jgi:hypothetical protein